MTKIKTTITVVNDVTGDIACHIHILENGDVQSLTDENYSVTTVTMEGEDDVDTKRN